MIYNKSLNLKKMESPLTEPKKEKKEYNDENASKHKKNHTNKVKKYISSRRAKDIILTNEGSGIRFKYKRYSLPSDIKDLNIDIMKIIEEVKKELAELKLENKSSKWEINSKLIENLKIIRKELSKENIPIIKIKNILENDIQKFIDLLIELINNSNDILDLEILWILNNIIYFASKYNIINLDSIKISNKISSFYLNQINNTKEFKYTLIEKMNIIFGNILFINNKIIYTLINNNIITYIIDFLNKPFASFRITCLWLLNKILKALKEIEDINSYINIFTNKFAIVNYNFIYSRINNISLDEISEFFWFLCELSKYNSKILIPIFFNGYQNFKNYENILQNFEFILNNNMTNKLSQITFRLVSNLLVVCNKDINNEYLLNKFIEIFFEKKSVILYINDILNSPINKYDLSLVKDVILLIFNLICLSPVKSIIYFKKGIVNLISDRYYQMDKEMMKLLFLIYYKILINNYFYFELNDEKVIIAFLTIYQKYKDNENILIIFIDIFYFYLKAAHATIDDELQNEIEFIKLGKSPKIENYQYIFEKLANIVKKASPLSKFLR